MILDAENVNKKYFITINYDFLFKAVKFSFYVCRNKKYFQSTTTKKLTTNGEVHKQSRIIPKPKFPH